MNRFAPACIAALLSLAATQSASAGAFNFGHFSDRLQLTPACTLSQAMGVAVDNHVKPVATLPQSGGYFRFLGTSYDTGKLVGAAVAVSGCSFILVTDIGMKHPWCEYLPSVAARCPSSFAQ